MSRTEVWTYLKILAWTRDYLASKGIGNARLEAEWMLCAVTGSDRVGLYLNFEKPLNDAELSEYRGMVKRRARREPLQHILGSQEFYGLEFEVTPDVLIPRYDTEVLVSEALKRKPDARSILDIGTGSGNIAIALAVHLPAAEVTAVDISESALDVAKRNAARHSVNVTFLTGSLFEPVRGRQFDLIVSNPPYIPTGDILGLEPEVRDFDPRSALDGGVDGLDVYRVLLHDAREYQEEKGWVLLEAGIHQAADIRRLFHLADGFDEPITVNDSEGIERVVGARRKDTR